MTPKEQAEKIVSRNPFLSKTGKTAKAIAKAIKESRDCCAHRACCPNQIIE